MMTSSVGEDFDPNKNIIYCFTRILQPMSMNIFVNMKTQHEKINFIRAKIDSEQLFMKLDFKDIEFLYYLSKKSSPPG
jgi:hypothetical protein